MQYRFRLLNANATSVGRLIHSSIIMAALIRSRCGHYIFVLWFLLFSAVFFRRLFSAVADWMSTILPHMMWP